MPRRRLYFFEKQVPQWFYQRPPEQADPDERLVADALNNLGDDWTVRWGWHYADNAGVRREGDFLILGPGGHMLVLEVKGTQLRSFARTGYWENDGGRDPLEQLDAEWKAALAMLEVTAAGAPAPFVHRAFALPNLHLLGVRDTVDRLPPEQVADKSALDDFGSWWQQNVATFPNRCGNSRKLFLDTFAKGIKPDNLKLFIGDSERLFARYRNTEMRLLRRLWPNRQLLVRGGPGSGKTFMALQTARHFAEADDGNDVLFVCYNLALGALLVEMAERLRPARGSVTVRTWESLAAETLAGVGVVHTPPEAREDRSQYYDVDLPGYLHLAVNEGLIAPAYDALVVDEAQDLDTRFPEAIPDAAQYSGWWSFLLRLLREGAKSRAALFYDPAQRPGFRPERFHITDLVPVFSQPALVQLDQAVRFTRPLFAYLRGAAGDHPLFAGLSPHERAPEGPDVVTRAAAREKTAEAAAEILRGWFKAGLCTPRDICILGRRRSLGNSSLAGCAELAGHPLADYPVPGPGGAAAGSQPHNTLRYLSLNRAKGLDFLAVLLIDIPRDTDLDGFLLAATRARQMLGVVEAPPAENTGM